MAGCCKTDTDRAVVTVDPEIRKEASMPGKRVQFDDETWNALDLLARDRM